MYQQIFKLAVLPLVLVCFRLLPIAQAANETTINANTGEGSGALQSITTGSNNTALGAGALFSLTTGIQNTATGAQALKVNTADQNTADGFQALNKNTTGTQNTATGWRALFQNIGGSDNVAIGFSALYNNRTGFQNTAIGSGALNSNRASTRCNAVGHWALFNNDSSGKELSDFNNAHGDSALFNNVDGAANNAFGDNALSNNVSGIENTAMGDNAGREITGSGNVCIGAGVVGVGGESDTTRIRNVYSSVANGRAVYVNSDNKIGTLSSSRRYKEEIQPMDKTSEAVLALKPVTFRYKKEVDPARALSFGLIAEEVAKICPDLITRDQDGKPETVRYEAVNAMLLNEFLKEHRTVQEQQKEIDALKSELKEQKALIQKVSDKLELNKPARQTVANNQ